MNDSFLEGLGQKHHYTGTGCRLALIPKESKMTAKRIAELTGVSVAAISQWLNSLVSKCVLIWCDESGIKFVDNNRTDIMLIVESSGRTGGRVRIPNGQMIMR